MTPAPDKKCPDCAEQVKAEARICRFCGYRFTAPAERRRGKLIAILLAIVSALGYGFIYLRDHSLGPTELFWILTPSSIHRAILEHPIPIEAKLACERHITAAWHLTAAADFAPEDQQQVQSSGDLWTINGSVGQPSLSLPTTAYTCIVQFRGPGRWELIRLTSRP